MVLNSLERQYGTKTHTSSVTFVALQGFSLRWLSRSVEVHNAPSGCYSRRVLRLGAMLRSFRRGIVSRCRNRAGCASHLHARRGTICPRGAAVAKDVSHRPLG